MGVDATALSLAGFSAVVSIGTAIYAQRAGSRQAAAIEALKTEQAMKLEQFKDSLARSRDADAKSIEARELVDKYRDPLLRAAYDLQSRIYNVYRPGGFNAQSAPEYFRLNTLFLFAELLGWLEIIRRELQFLDLGAIAETRDLGGRLGRLQDLLASTTDYGDGCYVYRGEQRAIGELMLCRIEGGGAGRRYECMGYAQFVAAHEKPEFARWFARFGDAIVRVPDDKPQRLIDLQHELIDFIDHLDSDHERFQSARAKLAVAEA